VQCAQCAAAEPLEHDFEKTRTTIQRRGKCRASLFLQDSDGEHGQDCRISLCGVGTARGDAQAGALVCVHGRPVLWSNELRARFVVLTWGVLCDYEGGEQCDHVSRSPGFLCVCACAGMCAGARRPSLKAPRSATRMGRWCVCGTSPGIVDSDDAGEQFGCIDASCGDCPGVCCHRVVVYVLK
jgi:hypothetical protein